MPDSDLFIINMKKDFGNDDQTSNNVTVKKLRHTYIQIVDIYSNFWYLEPEIVKKLGNSLVQLVDIYLI